MLDRNVWTRLESPHLKATGIHKRVQQFSMHLPSVIVYSCMLKCKPPSAKLPFYLQDIRETKVIVYVGIVYLSKSQNATKSSQNVVLCVRPSSAPRMADDSDSGRLTFLKETARSQEWLVLQATNAHQTTSHWLLFAKNCVSSKSSWL